MAERISVGRIPGGGVREVNLDQPVTVRQAFQMAELDPSGCVIKRNGQDAGLDDMIQPGDTLMAYTQKIKGN